MPKLGLNVQTAKSPWKESAVLSQAIATLREPNSLSGMRNETYEAHACSTGF